MSERLYFRQLLSGQDLGATDRIAQQMVNFVYLIGDRETGEAVVIDPAYGIEDLLGVLDEDGMTLTGALATHYHPDHVGGDMMGYSIAGVAELLRLRPVPIHVQADEAEWVKRVTGADDSDIHKITWENATRHFNWDPFAHVPREQATVGALRAKPTDVDTSTTSRKEYAAAYAARQAS